jgi:hypothetical protein
LSGIERKRSDAGGFFDDEELDEPFLARKTSKLNKVGIGMDELNK